MDNPATKQMARQVVGANPIAKCGTVYRIADNICPPKHYRWRLIFWDSVAYFTRRTEADTMQRELPYHQQEDSRIEPR